MSRSGEAGDAWRRRLTVTRLAAVSVPAMFAAVFFVTDATATGAGRAPSTKAVGAATARPWATLGRPATPAEIRAWDIDVRPDFKGLPPGSGTVAKGQEVWESKCESCHGSFGESNQVFTPIVGGTSKEDTATGLVAKLSDPAFPQRTTLMKLSQLSTLWDYVNRAMPWNAPKSLSVEEVYAVVAYILNLGEIVPADFTLSDRNIAEVQSRLPNRNGLVRHDGMWSVSGKPDVQGDACMTQCKTVISVDAAMAGGLPEHARDAHGNLAEQNRVVGPVRGSDTSRNGATPRPPKPGAAAERGPEQIARDSNCLACHAAQNKVVGPAFHEIAARYKGKSDAEDLLVRRVRTGGSGVWGSVAMPGNTAVADADIRTVIRWILSAN